MREATIHVPHSTDEQLGIGPFVSLCREAGLQDLTELACQGTGCLFVVTLESALLESELAALSGIRWWERLPAGDSEVVYLCKMASTEQSGHHQLFGDLDVSSNDIRVTDTGIDVSMVGTQSALQRSIETYEDLGVDVVLRKITEYTGPRSSLDAVTDRQHEILETAYNRGYFKVPRRATASEIAAELDLDPSTVTEHIRRAEQNLLSELFG